MEVSAFIIFALALLIAAGSPGPSVAALVARVLARGWHDVMPFVIAMWIGEAIWLSCAVAGLATLANTFHWLFLVIKYCGVAYLLYLAWQMWRAPVAVGETCDPPRSGGAVRMFFAGLAVTLGNPKIMVFYLALLPTIIDLNGITLLDWAGLNITMLLVLAGVDIGYIILATRVRILLKTPRAMRLSNRISAGVMGGAAAVIATRG
jgi:threonine/homoserine/homoserine lactone efflux protein